jgi:hypothetical protein
VIFRALAQVQRLIMPFWMALSAMRMASARLSGLPLMPEAADLTGVPELYLSG